MIFLTTCEFRGTKEKVSKKTGLIYRSISLEDVDGESLLFPVDESLDLSKLKKGDIKQFEIDYNRDYKSFKVIDVIDRKEVK